MKKTPSVFQRDYEGTRQVFAEVVPESAWVLDGQGVPTVKWDGTCCMVRDGKLYKRFDRKGGKEGPKGWEPAEPSPNQHTGHWPGWVLVGEGPEDRWHREAWDHCPVPDGTYELCGPKVGGNPHNFINHVLICHGATLTDGNPRTFDEIREFLKTAGIEGIVWHHPDGRCAKIKTRDFGFPWPPPPARAAGILERGLLREWLDLVGITFPNRRDDLIRRTRAALGEEADPSPPEHQCGVRGFDGMKGDVCPGCEAGV